jgi:hypothetical protein
MRTTVLIMDLNSSIPCLCAGFDSARDLESCSWPEVLAHAASKRRSNHLRHFELELFEVGPRNPGLKV